MTSCINDVNGGPKVALSLRFVHDASGDSTIIASQARLSSDARPQSATCWAAPVGDLPFRVSVSARSELKSFFNESDADIDRLTFSSRAQYVDPTNDQAFSPYFAITPRFRDYRRSRIRPRRGRTSISASTIATISIAPSTWFPSADTSSDTVWSFGLTSFVQRRLRQPQLSSDAVVLIPSASWVISQDWNASFAVEMLGRWYELDRFGEGSHDWEVLPITTLEYIIPASLFGSEQFADLLGRPSIDLQGSHSSGQTLHFWRSFRGSGREDLAARGAESPRQTTQTQPALAGGRLVPAVARRAA